MPLKEYIDPPFQKNVITNAQKFQKIPKKFQEIPKFVFRDYIKNLRLCDFLDFFELFVKFYEK
jgi:hypothetical protein